MSIFMVFRIALKALGRNKLRTALTMLGMIIGVGAVITMVALGKGAQATIEEQVKATGTNMITISPGNFAAMGVRMGEGSSELTAADAAAIRQLPEIQWVAEGVSTRQQIIAGNQNSNTQVQGTNEDWPLIKSWPMKAYGQFFTEQDVQAAAKVLVLGSNVRSALPRSGSDRAETSACNHVFKVIGVFTSKGASSGGQNQDDQVFTPH